MRSLSAIHWTIIGAAITSIVLLGFVRTTPPSGKQSAMMAQPAQQGVPLQQLISKAQSQLKAPVQQEIKIIAASIETDRDFAKRGQMYDSLIHVLAVNESYLLAAWYAEQKAEKNGGSANDWLSAGDRYRNSVQFMEQEDQQNASSVYGAAMRCYKKTLELDPKNLDAQVGLGSCIVKSTNDPMTGVKMLLRVDSIDSLNVNVQIELAEFDIQSNQLPNAIKRYNKVLRLKPEYFGIHLALADLYGNMGDTASEILHLKAYEEIQPDPVLKNEVENQITQIRNMKKTDSLKRNK